MSDGSRTEVRLPSVSVNLTVQLLASLALILLAGAVLLPGRRPPRRRTRPPRRRGRSLAGRPAAR
ncbi:MAG: hypothetical protein ACRDT6_04720 [Micromonosporaceae bacterium]